MTVCDSSYLILVNPVDERRWRLDWIAPLEGWHRRDRGGGGILGDGVLLYPQISDRLSALRHCLRDVLEVILDPLKAGASSGFGVGLKGGV